MYTLTEEMKQALEQYFATKPEVQLFVNLRQLQPKEDKKEVKK